MTEQALNVRFPSASALPASGAYVLRYVDLHLSNVGKLGTFAFWERSGHQNIAGGRHAAALDVQTAIGIHNLRDADPDGLAHIFAACPNNVLFFMGQHHQGNALYLASCRVSRQAMREFLD